jgi:hypothetical protein
MGSPQASPRAKGRRKHVPLRTCIACGRQRPKRELIRIVRTPEGTTEIDPKGKRAGRGTYLCPNRRCWTIALERGSLGRALKGAPAAEEIETLRTFMATLPESEEALEPGAVRP